MYTGYELTEESRNKLAQLYPPKNPTWLGHHITEVFGVKGDYPKPDSPDTVSVIGYLESNGIEGFLVSVDGNVDRPSGGKYHITWSIDKSKGVKPLHTNKLVNNPQRISPIEINVTPKVFTKSTEQSLQRESIPDTFLDFLKENAKKH